MYNFNIGAQIEKERDEFLSDKVKLASFNQNESVRYAKVETSGYYFNQAEAITLVDLYYNSKFETGPRDRLGQKKIFMNVGKFRSDVASKQIDIDVKDFRFLPDDYSDPWVAIFLQKDFKEWAKDSCFGELVNQCVDNLPKYGSIVLKKVGKEIIWTPLQLLKNQQTADSLQTASFVIEEHPDMYYWELQEMKGWDLKGLDMKYDECIMVYERYGYVPLKWLKEQNEETVLDGDDDIFVDALVIVAANKKEDKESHNHIFFCQQIKQRPYREAHWNRQHGRWLGVGVMEDLIENQQAKNLIVNLIRRSLNWSSKRVLQSVNQDIAAKNLVRDVQDGDILEVGPQGAITQVDLTSRSGAEFQQFLQEFEKNSDQKAFTYESATGESLPSGTPFRLGVLMTNAVNSYFQLKKEKLGLFLKKTITDFLIPQFLRDMTNEDRVLAMFDGESGFEVLKEAAMDHVRNEAARISILSGKPVDVQTLIDATTPFDTIKTLFFKMPKTYYQEAKFKFDFTITGEELDLQTKLTTLQTIYQSLAAQQDPRAEKVLDRIAALSGENMSLFGTKQPMAAQGAAVSGAQSTMPNVPSPTPA